MSIHPTVSIHLTSTMITVSFSTVVYMYFANSKQVVKPITAVVPKTLSRNMMTMVQWPARITGGWTPVVNLMRMSQVGGFLSRLLIAGNTCSLHRLAVHHRSSSLNTPARSASLSNTSSPSSPSLHPLTSHPL